MDVTQFTPLDYTKHSYETNMDTNWITDGNNFCLGKRDVKCLVQLLEGGIPQYKLQEVLVEKSRITPKYSKMTNFCFVGVAPIHFTPTKYRSNVG